MLNSQRATMVTLISTVLKTDGSTNTVSHDMSGYRAGHVNVNLSLEEGTDARTPTITLSEGDTTDATNLTVIGSTTVDLQTARSVNIHFQPRKKLIVLNVTLGTGTGNDVMFGATLSKYRAAQEPENTSEMVGSTHDVCIIR